MHRENCQTRRGAVRKGAQRLLQAKPVTRISTHQDSREAPLNGYASGPISSYTTRCEPCLLCDTSQHSGSNFLTVVKGNYKIRRAMKLCCTTEVESNGAVQGHLSGLQLSAKTCKARACARETAFSWLSP